MAIATATALSGMLRAGPRRRSARTRRTARPSSHSKASAPGTSPATTRVSNPFIPAAIRCESTWIPPRAGGKSGVRTSSRGLGGIGPKQSVAPETEGKQPPEQVAVVVGAGEMLRRQTLGRGAVEPSLLVDRAAIELAAQRRGQGSSQPLRRGRVEGRLAKASRSASVHPGWEHRVQQRLAPPGEVERGVDRGGELGQLPL